MSEPATPAEDRKPPVGWLGRCLAGCAWLLAVSLLAPWWSGMALLPFMLIVLAPTGALLQALISWIGRKRVQVVRVGTPALWLLPALWMLWMAFKWQRPSNVFRMVAGFEPPAGITGLRTRMVWGMDGWACVCFEATDALKQDLITKAGLELADGYSPDVSSNPQEQIWLRNRMVERANQQTKRCGLPRVDFRLPEAFRRKNPTPLSNEGRELWIIDREGPTVCIVL